MKEFQEGVWQKKLSNLLAGVIKDFQYVAAIVCSVTIACKFN